MHKSLLFVLLLLAPVARAFAQADLKQQIADTLNAIANRDIWAGNVTVRSLYFNHRAKSATVTVSSNLGYLPFRPETVDELVQEGKTLHHCTAGGGDDLRLSLQRGRR